MEIEDWPILACTVCRDIQNFELLIVDMEEALREQWGDLSFSDAHSFLTQPEASELEFLAIAIDDEDEAHLPEIIDVVKTAKDKGVHTLIIAEDISPATLHRLLKSGASEFVPYPLPQGELVTAIQRMRKDAAHRGEEQTPSASHVQLPSGANRRGKLFGVQGLAGGTGATTFAVNLAWELAEMAHPEGRKVCLIDFDLQFGAVSTYLDVPRRETVYEMLADTEGMDDEIFAQALQDVRDKLSILTSPADILPLDMVTSEDIDRILTMAKQHFDFVIVDMPKTLVQWTEAVLSKSEAYFAVLEIDMRSVQNTLRFRKALASEDLPSESLRFVLNRAPKFTDLNGKNRMKRISESLDIRFDIQLPDGGKPVVQSADHGLPLEATAPKNVLRKEIAKVAAGVLQHGQKTKAA